MTLSAALVFGSTFLTVFALGLQSLNVNQGHYVAAAVTSGLISTGHLWLYKTMPDPTWLDITAYYIGGITGIVASMWFHRSVKVWWREWRERRQHFPACAECGAAAGQPCGRLVCERLGQAAHSLRRHDERPRERRPPGRSEG